MGKYVEVEAIRKLFDENLVNICHDVVLKVISEVPTMDVVECKECKHKTYCYGDVIWTNKRQTVDIHKTVNFCSYGEKETSDEC